MAGEMKEEDVSICCNQKNLTMLKDFLRPKVLGLTLAGRTDLEELDVYMHHPAEIFGSEPGSMHKFFFANRLWKRAGAHDAGPKARGGYWLTIGESEIIKENDGTPIGSKKQRVFHEGMHIKSSKRTNWHLNEYVIFEEQPLKSNDDKKKKEAWVLCELFQQNVAEEKEGGQHNSEHPDQAGLLPVGLRVPSSKKMLHLASRQEAFPVVNPTLAGDQPSDAISGVEKLNQTPSGSHDGPSDAQPSARSAGGWKEKRVEDYTSLDHDEFLAFTEECLNNPPEDV